MDSNNEIANSEEDEIVNSGDDDWDESILDSVWDDDDVFRAPTCPNPECSDSNLHFSGTCISICLNCRSVQASGARTIQSARDAFPYRPVMEDSELRLLVVWPPRDKQDSIHCSLIHGRLGTDIEYDAASYTWADETGDDSRNKTIFIDDLPLPVTTTCEAVLRRTRLRSTAKVLWIDAVCINQDDKDERGHQVRLMPDIYSHAKKVLIFPGEASEEDSRGFYYLPELERFFSRDFNDAGSLSQGVQGEEPGLDIWKSVQRTMKHLFSRRYFTRVWILQEIDLAKEPIILYGSYEAPWITIRTAIRHAGERYRGPSTWSYYNLGRPLLHPSEPLPRVLNLGSAIVRGPSDLLHLLDKARNSQAHDPRDKVFALFGMIRFADRLGLVADYNQSVEEAFAGVAVWLSAEHGLLPMLARTIGTPARRAVASWVPDWSNPGSHPADRSPSNEPKFPEESQLAPGKDRNLLDSLTHIPVLARQNDYEMDFIGVWVCDLGTLFYAGLDVQVFTIREGAFFMRGAADLEVLYRALDLPEGGSLCCYLPMSPTDSPTRYLDEHHLERELKQLRDANPRLGVADLFRQRRSDPRCELILSSGLDGFGFAGLCVVSPSSITRVLSDSRCQVPDDQIPNDMRWFLGKELVSLVSRHRLAAKIKPAPPTSKQSAASITLGGLLARTTAGKLQGPIRSSPSGLLGGEDGWLKGWADRELHFLDDLLQTPEGKAMLRELDMSIISPDDTTPRRPLGLLVDTSLDNLLGHDPVEFQRLTFKLGD